MSELTIKDKSHYKMAGAKSLAKLGKAMREKQNAYYKESRDSRLKQHYLSEAKRLEMRFDDAVERIIAHKL